MTTEINAGGDPTCQRCSFLNRASDQFCTGCGAAIIHQRSTPPAAPTPTMGWPAARSVVVVVVMMVLASAAIGCGASGTAPPILPVVPVPTAASTTAPTPALTAPPQPSISRQRQPEASGESSPRPSLPNGRVPDAVVGKWSGGVGAKTGEYLVIAPDGRYARGRNGSDPYRQGVVVAKGSEFVTYDLDGRQESGQWEYTNAAGIEVLGVYFGGDYYSYARG